MTIKGSWRADVEQRRNARKGLMLPILLRVSNQQTCGMNGGAYFAIGSGKASLKT